MTGAGATAWGQGRLDGRRGPRQLLFGRMYEDAAIESAAFVPGGRIFCIASAGCTAFALAPRHAVVAVDVNPVQIDYVRRRISGASESRGAAERVVGLGRSFTPLLGWSASRLRAFLDLEDPREQIDYWRGQLDTRRFRAAFDFLLSMAALRLRYAPELLGVLPRGFGRVLRGRMERCFARHSNRARRARSIWSARMPRVISSGRPPAASMASRCRTSSTGLTKLTRGACMRRLSVPRLPEPSSCGAASRSRARNRRTIAPRRTGG
jgi:hypothetical protein